MITTAAAGTETRAAHQPGHEIAPGYRVIEHMRRGSDFDTYDAWSETRYCRCFLKTPRPDRVDDPRVVRRLRLEGKLLLAFTHPHLVRAYEFVGPVTGHPPLLVIETLAGSTLSYLLRDGDRLATRDLAYLGQHLCAALRYMHDRGYLHLDIKPSNIIANEGRARIVDLSLARRPGRHHGGIGTPAAMAPEQVRGGRLGPAADAWGIGLVLYEAATGSQPFDTASSSARESISDILDPRRYPQLNVRALPVRSLRRLPRPLANAIDRCLEPAPDQRPSLSELNDAMTAVTGEANPAASLTSSRDEATVSPPEARSA
jgi:eukaryotic-like serine/threonine-protein kinase